MKILQKHTKTYNGITGRIILHEYDHIDGKLFIDHLSPLKRKLLKRKLDDISKGAIKVDYRMLVSKKMKVVILILTVSVFSFSSFAQTDTSDVEAVRRMVQLSEVVVRSDLNVPRFLQRIKNDTAITRLSETCTFLVLHL